MSKITKTMKNGLQKQDLYYANIWTTLQHCFSIAYVLNILICNAWTSLIVDMPLSGAYNQKMAAIKHILTAEYERLGPN